MFCVLSVHWTLRRPNDLYKTGVIYLLVIFKKCEDEAAASKISSKETENEIALVDIIERFKEADEIHKKQTDEKKSKNVGFLQSKQRVKLFWLT